MISNRNPFIFAFCVPLLCSKGAFNEATIFCQYLSYFMMKIKGVENLSFEEIHDAVNSVLNDFSEKYGSAFG